MCIYRLKVVLLFSYSALQKLFFPCATGQRKAKKEITEFIPEKRRIIEKQMPPPTQQCLSSTLTEASYTPVIVAPRARMADLAQLGKSFCMKLPLKLDWTIDSLRIKSKTAKKDCCYSLKSWDSGVSWSFPRSYGTRDQGMLDLPKYPFLWGPGR